VGVDESRKRQKSAAIADIPGLRGGQVSHGDDLACGDRDVRWLDRRGTRSHDTHVLDDEVVALLGGHISKSPGDIR
jgi:hypothetical protein